MKTCVIYSNCQADGLALFLPKVGFDHEIIVYRNYQMILGEQKLEDLVRDALKADVFIYQPTNDKHGDSSSENILNMLPATCATVSFAYVYNHGMHPLSEHGDKRIGAEFINPHYWHLELNDLLSLYDDGLMDFALWDRFLHCLAEQARREQMTDVKLTKWILEERDRRLLLNVNHPTSYMFVEIANQVMKALELQPVCVNGLHDYDENLASLPCTLPFSEYVRKEFASYRKTDADAHDYYRALLAREWHKQHKHE